MHLVAVHGWQKEEPAVVQSIAEQLGLLVFDVRQKIAGGGPVVLASFADARQAATLAANLCRDGVPALVVDTAAVRGRAQPHRVRRCFFESQVLRFEAFGGAHGALDYAAIDLLLAAACGAGPTQASTKVTERKFSLGRTLLAGGMPMTRTVTREETVTVGEGDETLRLYADGRGVLIFDRGAMNYDGFGAAMKLSRELNFSFLKQELRRRAPQAQYDERLLRRASLTRLLGPTLNPATDLDLALEILFLSLRRQDGGSRA